MKEKERKNKTPKLLIPTIILLIGLPTILLLLLILSYKSWEKDFESNLKEKEYITTPDTKEIYEQIEEELSSTEDVVALELTKEEVSSLLLDAFQSNESISLKGVYIEPIERGRWNIFLNISFLKKQSVWISLNMRKENRETAEIFLEKIYIGNFDITNSKIFSMKEKINRALSEALLTVEENGFVGRSFENIELLENSMVLRLERY